MGAVLAKFRKEKSSAEILEKLETDIRAIEKFSLTTQAKQKRLVGNFLVISIGLYAVGFLIFYFAFFPPTWQERITYSVPLLIFPLIIFLLRRLLAWYFQRKINKNSTKLVTLRAEKKRILEEVMEKETYNVASKLLSKYGDKSYGIKALNVTAATPVPNRASSESRVQSLNSSLLQQSAAPAGSLQPYNQMPLNRSLLASSQPYLTNGQQSSISPTTPRSGITTNTGSVLRHRPVSTVAVQRPTPYPIINQQSQSILEKMVDYLIADGPQNRFALICKECFAHNGMARQEEFEYATFRCAFCNALNPSRKSRPVAPRLPAMVASPLNSQLLGLSSRHSGSSESSTNSSDDSDFDTRRRIETEAAPLPESAVEKTEEPPAPPPVPSDNEDEKTNGTSQEQESKLEKPTENNNDNDVEMLSESMEKEAAQESETKE